MKPLDYQIDCSRANRIFYWAEYELDPFLLTVSNGSYVLIFLNSILIFFRSTSTRIRIENSHRFTGNRFRPNLII